MITKIKNIQLNPLPYIRTKLRNWLGITDNSAFITDSLGLIKRNADHINKLTKQVQKTDQRTKDLVKIGVDVHFKEPHMILIYSKLGGGQLRHISVDIRDMRELQELVRCIKHRYGTRIETWDEPPQYRGLHRRPRGVF